ncbi:hypothetical protein Godav_013768 [Gossypium davidsonii]|uniref:Uncharacterized protein n=1 Tax=Gossypium davidsonii TaxID=34287 RepID=A0A7J8RHH5_GOSDV|nr:hypothetical protein [Gossypium davidsonii]
MKEARRLYDEIWKSSTVRGKELRVTPREICVRNRRPDTELPTNFNQAIMFPVAEMWMQLICTRITPALNVSNICNDAFITKKLGSSFPHLVTALCRNAKVPMENHKQFMKPTKILIRDSLEPNYLPNLDISESFNTGFDKIRNERGGEEEDQALKQDFQSDADDYETAFQLQCSIPKGPIIRSPTQHAPSTGRSSHQRYGSGKGKTLIERGH